MMAGHRISVIIYSFQKKDLLDYVLNLFSTAEMPDRLNVYITDQNNIDRHEMFAIQNVNYLHKIWDDLSSPILDKQKMIDLCSGKHILQIGDSVKLNKNWDTDLINYLNKDLQDMNKVIISGNSICNFFQKNIFMVGKKNQEIDKLSQNFSITRDFVFGRKSDFQEITYPVDLKYYGEEESITMSLLNKGYSIYSVPTNFYTNSTLDLSSVEYLPFSIYHNYNRFIIKNKKEINEYLLKVNGYKKDSPKVRELPFEDSDVVYNRLKSKVDKIGGNRYLNNIREIN
jgi:hypothetical protein